MNKFREVSYTGDGCSEWQCLSCKKRWEARTPEFLFCPFCGIKFEGMQASRPHGTPRWAWERWGKDIPEHIEEAILASEGKRHHVVWEMQTRHTGGTANIPNEWKKDFRITTLMCSGAARWRMNDLIRSREAAKSDEAYDDWHVETYGHELFRYIIVKP